MNSAIHSWRSSARQRLGVAVTSLALAILLAFTVLLPSVQAQTLTTLYSFTGGADGKRPTSPLIHDSAGNLYGTTEVGGGANSGVVFKLGINGVQTVLYSFSGGADDAIPTGALARDAAGNLYGTAYNGGDLTCGVISGCGTVFKLSPAGKFTVLHTFAGRSDGALPDGGVIRDAEGNLYGTTSFAGGDSKTGTVFKLDAAGNETVLYRFTGKADGGRPIAGVTLDADGNLYGTTYLGGTFHHPTGTVFKLDSTGKETVLHTFIFSTEIVDGLYPYAGVLINGTDLYGMTTAGGTSGLGTVFKVDQAGNETVLYSFAGESDGRNPDLSGLTRDAAGNLYGTTENGGDLNGDGTVFMLDTTGNETILHRFSGSDGSQPTSGVIVDPSGNLYGTTLDGGAFGWGTVFKIKP